MKTLGQKSFVLFFVNLEWVEKKGFQARSLEKCLGCENCSFFVYPAWV